MKHGLGYIPDWLDMRDHGFRDIEAPTGWSAGSADMRDLRGAPLSQGPLSSCVGFAITRALQLGSALNQRPDIPLASPLFIYWNARFVMNREKPVDDRGCYPRLAMKALQTFGFAPWSSWEYKESWVNQQPSFKAYRGAYEQRGFRYYRIDGDDRVAQVRQALAMGYPVIFGMEIDEAFVNARAPVSSIDRNRSLGGHMMSVLAVDGDNLVVDNWWGTGWGGNGDGTGVISADLFESSHIHDVYALSVEPIVEQP